MLFVVSPVTILPCDVSGTALVVIRTWRFSGRSLAVAVLQAKFKFTQVVKWMTNRLGGSSIPVVPSSPGDIHSSVT